MFTARGIERVAAVLLLAVFLGVVVVLITGPGPFETSRDEIRATLLEIEADSGLFATSAAFLIFVNLITIPLAAALYIVFRSHDQPLALFGSFGFLTIGILHVALGAMLFSFQALARDFVDAGGAQQADAVVASVRTITPMLEILFPAGSMGIALGVIAYGALLVRTAALPRWVG